MGVKLSDLTTESSPASNDILMIADPTTGIARKITVSALKTFMDGLGGGVDTTAPTIVSATASTASTITIVFSESVTVTTAGWSFKINGANWPISSVSGSGSTWTFTMSTSGASTDTILRSYNSGTGATVDTSSNELVSFTDSSVTNSIPAGGSYDADADAFFTYKSITDITIKDAINQHVLDLKAAGLWATKITDIYPFVGGDSSKHAGNLRRPTAPYDLTYRGSPTHSSQGMDCGSGTVGAETYIVPSTVMDITDLSMGVYVRQNEAVSTIDRYQMGCTGANSYILAILPRYTGDTAYFGMTDSGSNVTATNTDSTGFYSLSRTANNVGKGFKNGSQIGSTFSSTQTTLPTTHKIGIGGTVADSGGTYVSGENQVAYAFVGKGLSDAEMLTLYNSVQDLQTALSRNV